jgi:hypothetical protein
VADKKPTIADIRKIEEDRQTSARETASNFGQKALNALGAPQRAMSRGFSQMAGLPAKQTSEENFQQLADLVPDINPQQYPIASTALSAGKALGVAGAEVFADPLNAIGAGALKRVGKSLPDLARMAKDSGAVQNAAKIFGSGTVKKVEQAAVGAAERAKALDEAAKVIAPPTGLITAETSRATPTYDKLMKSKLEQEARIAAANPERVRGNIEMGRDARLMQQGIEEAQKTGAKNPEAFARLWARARGGFKP